ncbi:MAG: amylo-alpha-1,6-glucosidase [Phormidesmis sp.]
MSISSVNFGRDVCSDITQSTQREWLITNGIGGYGCGTVSGILTRCYHGFLVASLKPPLARTLLLTKLDEVAQYQNKPYPLSSDRWSGGTTTGHGYNNTQSFRLEGTTPTWTYACADALLEKRIWMQQGENTTYVRYTLRRASATFRLTIKAIINYRDHHHITQSTVNGKTWRIQTQAHPRGLKVVAFDNAIPFYLCTSKGQLIPNNKWYQNYFLTTEQYRGLSHLDDHFHAATLTTTLLPGESVTFTASTQPTTNLEGTLALQEKEQHEKALLSISPFKEITAPIQQLTLAADQFIVSRTTPETPNGKTIIAGYPWFGDWGRDTMIALPGLTLSTGRAAIARPILRTFARYLSQGMLPNAFPEANDNPGYNTVDAILWYFEAIRAYTEATDDLELLEELYPALQEVIDWHQRGTRYNIQLDNDGLLYAGEKGHQLTWMDAKVDDWVVTPRIGKPVEINALWCNALRCMVSFSQQLNQSAAAYQQLLSASEAGFERFWQLDRAYLADVLDGPNGNDMALRPNQLFAVSLHGGPTLSAQQQKSIVDTCAQHLLTSHGLRSLAPTHPDYIGTYGGDRTKRDGSYHQGTTWGWLIGPFVQAHFKVYKNSALARTFLQPLCEHLTAGCTGTLSEIFDGDVPFTPRGAYAQAWTVAEVLRLYQLIEKQQKP